MTAPPLAAPSARPACADAPDPDAFLPAHNEAQMPRRARRLARDYCYRCPIRQECSDQADAHRDPGLWGGTWRRTTGSRERKRYEKVSPL